MLSPKGVELKIAEGTIGNVWLALVIELLHTGGVVIAGMASEGTACGGRTGVAAVKSCLPAHHLPWMVVKTAVIVKRLGSVRVNYSVDHA